MEIEKGLNATEEFLNFLNNCNSHHQIDIKRKPD